MANNDYVNKVKYGSNTLIDLTNDTAGANQVLEGYTFHSASGEPSTGALITHAVYDDLDSSSSDMALSAKQGKFLYDKVKGTYVTSLTELKNAVPIGSRDVTIIHAVGAVTNALFGISRQSLLFCIDYGSGYIEITGMDSHSELCGCSLKRSDDTIEDFKTYCKSRLKKVKVSKSITISTAGGYTTFCNTSDIGSDCSDNKILSLSIGPYSGNGTRTASISNGTIYVSSSEAITNKAITVIVVYDADDYVERSTINL